MAAHDEVDVLVIGAGFSGIYQLYSCRSNGYKTKLIEMGSEVGGTWYWNKYPGAMSDTESYLYRYSWDKEDLKTYPWTHYYVKQPEILAYLKAVVERHDLRQDISLETEMESADFDEERNVWQVKTSKGSVTARYLVSGMGLLNKIKYPEIKGIETFQGEKFHTARFPEKWDFSNKRVAIIGNGSTGVQCITELGKPGKCKTLTSFQRHPQYTVPSGDGPVPSTYRETLNEDWDNIWDEVFKGRMGFGFTESVVPALSVSEAERDKVYQTVWDRGGGFRFMFYTFGDLIVDPAANETAAAFIRNQIAKIVRDPKKAKALTPHDLYARRPLCDGGYYNTFNNQWVDIVDLRETPIQEITTQGIKTTDEVTHVFDVLIFATGFDAMDGSYRRLDIRGQDGKLLNDHWSAGARSYLGVCVAGFPNMFMLLGPYGPFGNNPPMIETGVEFVTECIKHAMPDPKTTVGKTIEATEEAENQWMEMCEAMGGGTLFTKLNAPSWVNGSNIEGKKRGIMFYLGGLGPYREQLKDVMGGEPEWKGFSLS